MLLWRVVRLSRTGRLDEPTIWIEQIVDVATASSLFDALLRFLGEDTQPIDLGDRVMWELPDDGEAHYVDDDGDLIAVLVLLTALRPGEFRQRSTLFARTLRYRRERVEQIARELAGEGRLLSRLGLPDRSEDALVAISAAIDEFERREIEVVRAAHVREELIYAILDAAQNEALNSLPLSVLDGQGALSFDPNLPRSSSHEFRLHLERRMLVDDAPADVGVIGEHAGHLVAQYNQYFIEDLLRRSRSRTWRLPGLAQRVVEALSSLEEAGRVATHVFAPSGSWRLRRELLRLASHRPESDAHKFGPADLVWLDMRASDSLYVASVPATVRWTLVGDRGRWLTWTVTDSELASVASEQPKVTLSLFERQRVSIDRSSYFRVAIPESLRE